LLLNQTEPSFLFEARFAYKNVFGVFLNLPLFVITKTKGGETAQAKSGDAVKVHYTGVLSDGRIFDTSVDQDALQLTMGKNR